MPSFNIVRTIAPAESFRVAAVMGRFDLQTNQVQENFQGRLELPEHWNIGAIIGASGTGKTTIAQELFPNAYHHSSQYSSDTILNDMPEECSIEDITNMFCTCGFASPPNWLKPYDVLSQGEKMRVDLARALLTKTNFVVFDEFTSVVDRHIAQIGSFAVQKTIRKLQKQFIAVSCHYDILDWLLPDWVFNTDSMSFSLCSKKKDQTSLSKSLKPPVLIGACLLDIII